MYNSFISVVSLIVPDPHMMQKFLRDTSEVLRRNFSDYEIILVNNRALASVKDAAGGLEPDASKNIYIINLSKKLDPDTAIVAGLDRANGDYVAIFDMNFAGRADILMKMYDKTQENFDIVYLKYKNRAISFRKKIFYKLFYFIMKHCSDLAIDPQMHSNRMISRRALNAILQYRESLRYMKGLYSFIGYNSAYIEADIPDTSQDESFSSQIGAAIRAITSFTNLANRIFLWLLVLSLLFFVTVSINAVTVKFAHHDIFGNPAVYVPGWTFLVVFLSMGFFFQIFILYIVSIYLISMNSEIKRRPLYIIESVDRI